MNEEDFFGLEREQKIRKSGVRSIYTPHQPIHSIKLFFGREALVKRLIEQINTPGQHALLYGDRGVGKSSLANVTAHLLLKNLIKGKLYTKRCDSQDSFETILAEPLKEVGIDLRVASETKSHKEGGSAGVQIPVIATGSITSYNENTFRLRSPGHRLSPSYAAEALKDLEGLIVIDESDAIRTAGDKRRLSEFIKLLSDGDCKLKVLMVGIAQTAEDLMEAHQSVQRCLKETKLERMSDNELRLIIEGGANKLKLLFQPDVVDAIIRMSWGYPHFTHLLALKCAEDAIAEGRQAITHANLQVAVRRAVEDAEETLRRTYADATRSSGTDMYRQILCGAASIEKEEFTAKELRNAVSKITQRKVQQTELNNYFQRLVSEKGATILKRITKGVYRFNDPRIPSFIRIANHQVWASASKPTEQ
ncbi:MAG: ATP-binding protein [Syntrophaceae bacterium]|nr:ATP-binding protein [Syntrophaceae bacterium]